MTRNLKQKMFSVCIAFCMLLTHFSFALPSNASAETSPLTITYDFRDAAFEGRENMAPWNTREVQPGWTLEGRPNVSPVLGLQNYGITIGSTAVGHERTFYFDVPEDGFYKISFEALSYSAGGIGEFLVDGSAIGQFNFYYPTSNLNTQILSVLELDEGTHSLTIRVIGKDTAAPAPPAAQYRMTASNLILEKQDVQPEVDQISLTVKDPEFHVGYRDKLLVTGEMSDGTLVYYKSENFSYESSDPEIAYVDEDGQLHVVGLGAAMVTVLAEMNGVPQSASMDITSSSIIYDFRDADFEGRENYDGSNNSSAWNTRTIQPGWTLEGLPTHRPVLGLQYYGVSIGSTGIGDQRTFYFDVPQDGFYELSFGAFKYSAGGIAEFSVNGDVIGTYNFYSTQQGIVTEPFFIKYLQAGTHTLTFGIIGKDPAAPPPPANEYRMTATHFTLDAFETAPVLQEFNVYMDQSALYIGSQANLLIYGENPDGLEVDLSQTSVQYTSLDETTAVIDHEGKVTPLQIGTAHLQVEVTLGENTYSDTLEIPIVQPELAEIEAALYRTAMFIGDEFGVEVEGTLADGKEADLTTASFAYESTDPAVVTIDSSGWVTGVSAGEATISTSVTLDGVTQSTQLPVTVEEVTNAKTRTTVYTTDGVNAARNNVNLYDWAEDAKQKAVAKAEKYLALGHDQLWNLITPQSIPRAFTTNQTAGSPITGDAIEQFGAYPWIADPLGNPWKLTDPTSGYVFPTNDFWAYYQSGLNKHGIFEAELADQSLLVNELYPEKGEKWGVDDGTGWIDEHGNKFLFVAYYNHWHNWGREHNGIRVGAIIHSLTAFRDAYLYTGDPRYSRAGIIMLDRIADVYPDMNLDDHDPAEGYLNSTGGTDRGKVLGSIWESIMVNYLLEAYDAFFPAIDDTQVIDYLSAKSDQYELGVLKKSAEGIRRNIEDGIIRQIYPAVKRTDIRGNTGMHQANLALAAVVLDTLPETKEWLDFTFQAGNFYLSTKEITGGDVLGSLVDSFDRDGGGYHSSPGYNELINREYTRVAEVLEGYDLYPSADLFQNVKLKKTYDSIWPLTLSDGFTANIGDSGVTGNKTSSLSLERMVKAFEIYREPIYAQLAYDLNGNRTDGIFGDIFTPNPEQIAADIEQVIAEHGPLNLKATNMTGFGFSAFRDGEITDEGSTQRSLWMFYGPQRAHGHADTLNIGIHAYGLDLLPELGYPEFGGGAQYHRDREWMRNTISHNTVMVDKKGQIHAAAQPRHFDDGEMVKVMDVEAPKDYPQTEMYRRTTALIKVDEENSYAVDFFRVKGGQDHHFSFHSADGIVTTEGLQLTEQPTGTYEGPDVEYGAEEYNHAGSGFHYLDQVSRDENPSDQFSVDWNVKDTWNYLGNGAHAMTDVHLRLTMMEDVDNVALANGYPPQNKPGNPESLRYFIAHRTGENLESTFTSVIEPYKGERYIASIEQVPVKSEGEVVTEDVRAVKVVLENGRMDYIVSALDKDTTYTIDDTFEFQGFFGVYSEKNGMQVGGYVNDGTRIGNVEMPQASLSGNVLDFTKELSMENELIVTFNDISNLEDLVGRYIYIENDGINNAVYKIEDVQETSEGTFILSTGDISYIRAWKDKFDFDQGFVYDFAEGAAFAIPLSAEEYMNLDLPDSSAGMIALVEEFETEGHFGNENAVRMLTLHLTAVDLYEQRSESNKVIEHMNSLEVLLDHQLANEWITKEAYDSLQMGLDAVLKRWMN